MMKKLLSIVALALSLTGCVTAAQVTAGAAQVQGKISAYCDWREPVANLAKMLSASPIIQSADAFAKMFCDAVTTRPLADGPARNVRVNGILVRGKPIR